MDASPPHLDGRAGPPTSALLADLAGALEGEHVSVDAILAVLGERAVGLLLLILALPMCVPNVPGISTIFGLLIIAPAMQLMLAQQKLWLPAQVRAWTVPRSALNSAIHAALPFLCRIETFIRPRWVFFIRPPAEQWLGFQTFVMALVLLLPIPGGNWPPGITVAATGLALAQRDGRLALITAPLAAISVAVAWLGFRIGMMVLGQMMDFLAKLLGAT